MSFADDVLHAMRRLESIGETSVHPSRVADFMPPPRPSLGAMWHTLGQLYDADRVIDGKAADRFSLPPRPYAVDEQLSIGAE